MRRFECWRDPPGGGLWFGEEERVEHCKEFGLIEEGATLEYVVEAETWVEAMTIHHEKQGWEPYTPIKFPFGELKFEKKNKL